jgi:putative peptide zinc metalloprotease protein
MAAPVVNAADLERRKSLRIRIRKDISVEAHRYEGKTFYVVKDPVSLRYYRLKDNERFLLQYLDGKHTLEEAQKAYEKEYRPERLKLEDLEGFAQQLLTAGLAISDSPKAGQQLFERRGKRRNREFMQTFTNILYIKIPLFDPEWILNHMLKWFGFIFSLWFFAVSVFFMFAAIVLVATHFDTFLAKLPSYHEFFSFKTAIYLWIALGVVKVIHEFGHGLSCKRFGGEVHEMGALLMCFSPALYCNVSDAWILPNKWHRIIISAAGIYVELVIAAIATFVWWNTPTQPFINNLSLSLMIVCSVSTVVFNANPLMRYDGYYVLADWLEIPNLREKANRYLKNIVLDKCLGIEVPPEEYMELRRKILFIAYAIISYIYRWIVTFGILYLFWSFLRPYKLEVVGNLLTLAAIGSMTIWPLYNLGKSVYKRGRLPDMKRPRVMITTGVLLTVVAAVCLVPIPINRIRGLALVQVPHDDMSQLVLSRPAILQTLNVQAGQHVVKGQELAVFLDPDLEEKLVQYTAQAESNELMINDLRKLLSSNLDPADEARINGEIAKAAGERDSAKAHVESMEKIKRRELTILAPRDGIVGMTPRVDDVGRMFEGSQGGQGGQPIFTINANRRRMCMPLVTSEFNQLLEFRRRLKPGEPLKATIRIHGLDSKTWTGTIDQLDESEAKYIPMALSNRAGGPVAVHAPTGRSQGLTPQTQHYLIYIEIDEVDDAIVPGAMGQVKIYCQNETALRWAWRTINNVFNLRLL